MSNWKKYLRFKQIIFNSTMKFLAILNFSCFLIVFVHSLGHTKTSERLKLVCCGLYCVVLGFIKCFVLRYDEVTCGVVWIVVVVVILSMVCWESFKKVWCDVMRCGVVWFSMLCYGWIMKLDRWKILEIVRVVVFLIHFLVFFSVAQEFFATNPRHLILFEVNDFHLLVKVLLLWSLFKDVFKPQSWLMSWSLSFGELSIQKLFWCTMIEHSGNKACQSLLVPFKIIRNELVFCFAKLLCSISCRTTFIQSRLQRRLI